MCGRHLWGWRLRRGGVPVTLDWDIGAPHVGMVTRNPLEVSAWRVSSQVSVETPQGIVEAVRDSWIPRLTNCDKELCNYNIYCSFLYSITIQHVWERLTTSKLYFRIYTICITYIYLWRRIHGLSMSHPHLSSHPDKKKSAWAAARQGISGFNGFHDGFSPKKVILMFCDVLRICSTASALALWGPKINGRKFAGFRHLKR